MDKKHVAGAETSDVHQDSAEHYVETICVTEAEDSSYDSDCETDETNHEQVSRTTSDTLGQEFAEYVNQQLLQQQQQQIQQHQQQLPPHQQSATSSSAAAAVIVPINVPGYTSRVEFALKLGYTERLVQAALQRLGPDPTQNELLAELIKLGAQQQCGGSSSNKLNCDYNFDSSRGNETSPGSSSSSSGGPLLNAIDDHGSDSVGGAGGGITAAAATNISLSSSNNHNHTSANNGLRAIVIDGSNVAMSHGNKQVFSCRGIKICVDWFRQRGHKDIVVFVPKWRKEGCRPDNPIKDQEILNELERDGMLVFTPSRLVGGKRMVCYDDRYILRLAADNDGIVVSNDNYRDLVQESSEFKKVVEDRILMYSFVSDRFMPPDDPLGRSGPTLDNFLRIQPKKCDLPPPCPYGKKCTYGNKCKFNHPERGSGPHKSISERLTEHAARHLSARNAGLDPQTRTPVQGKSLSVPLTTASGDHCVVAPNKHVMGSAAGVGGGDGGRKSLCRTRSSNITDTQQYHGQYPAYVHHGQQQPTWQDDSMAMPPPTSPSQQNLNSNNNNNNNNGNNKQQQPQWPSRSSTVCDESGLDASGAVNLHRKLQRQLTLNPGGCDPRIYQIQRGMCGQQQQQPPPQQQPHSPHRPLEMSRSGPRPHWEMEMHPNVCRIASAPDSSRPWMGGGPPASSSEPQINLWPHHNMAASQQQQQHQHQQQLQDQRRRLHYHLASIFPEDQVQTVMQMYPDETNPQKICAAILNMFPKM